MKTTLTAAAVLALGLGGALAQAQNTTPSPTPGQPQTTAPGQTQNRAPGNAAPGANTGSPTSGTATGSSNPAVNPGGNAPSSVNASGQATIVSLQQLENGANSFTEGQARTRLEGAGLSNITELQKDDQGIWRGKAMRDGKSVTVGFDYKGNIGVQ
jgi:periplasmic protein CpxP/Spy